MAVLLTSCDLGQVSSPQGPHLSSGDDNRTYFGYPLGLLSLPRLRFNCNSRDAGQTPICGLLAAGHGASPQPGQLSEGPVTVAPLFLTWSQHQTCRLLVAALLNSSSSHSASSIQTICPGDSPDLEESLFLLSASPVFTTADSL
nr:uncharacterized protein LOC102133479 [Macaca fascicularis]XP_045254681.1 uncharacterized protein LOC102133479 [Macaca fascicularis]